LNKEFCKLAGITHRVIAAYHPQANGLVERENRNILSSLRKILQDERKEWDVAIYSVACANNASAKRAHNWKHSPFELMFWRKPRLDSLQEKIEVEKLDLLSDEEVESLMELRAQKVLAIQQVVLQGASESIKAEQVRSLVFFLSAFLGEAGHLL
jgi:transposase InsO family protein